MWNLLVVEDESIVRMGLKYMLPWEEMNIQWQAEASSGEQALQLIEEYNIHIVLTDIRMPGMSGLELAKQIQERDEGIQVLFLSSYDHFDYVKEGMRVGGVDYLHKPTMDESELAAAMKKVICKLEKSQEQISSVNKDNNNELLLSLLDHYTFPHNSSLSELEHEIFDAGFFLTVLRRREDAIRDMQDYDELQFNSLKYVVKEYIYKTWGGILFHRENKELIWIAPVRSREGYRGPVDKAVFLEQVKQKVLELLNVTLIYSESSSYKVITEMPDAYMEVLLKFPINEQTDRYIVRRAKEYIDRHLLEELTLTKVASAIHVSSSHLSRTFNKAIGEGFSEYIIRHKMEYAQRLLRETNDKVYEVAAKLGYQNPHYFSKLFKERTGMSPVDYRNQ